MFRTRSLFSRLFRLRKRRPAKADPGSANVAQASSSLSTPPPPPKQHRPVSLHPEAIHHAATPSTRRPHSLYPTLHLSPIAPSPLPTSVSMPTSSSSNVPLPRVILIEHLEDEPRVTFPPPPAHAPPSDVGARLAPSHLAPSPLPSASKSPHARCVSFQLPPTTTVVDADAASVAESDVDSDTDATAWQYRLATPSSSTCSTLVGAHTPHSEAVGKGKGETTEPAIVPTDPPPAYTYNTLVSTPSAPVSPSTSTSRSTTAKARHVSLFHPQPVRKNVARFSMPVRPTAGTGTGTRDGRRESKRTSAMMPLASGSGMTKKEKRTTRWSRELNKPGTQEVLMALRGI
ncbi:hypothetical protein L210DRAFT_2698508 [Boletus edulis BED1]|uniref:Uncharacterized protein n=1 Tax=Boletus edulis BED1 TaxID=1328754 RepID=A0AAD4BL72_BOLED|nr:hypothetical protein L210DRAFT_2698508 [Boletus edulis BED1]